MTQTLTTFEEFFANQKSGKYPYSQLPVITLSDEAKTMVCQSGAIGRYAAKLAGLYPSDPVKALFVDEAYEAITSAYNNFTVYGLSPEAVDEKKKAWIARDLARLNNFVKLRLTADSPFIANKEFSFADIGFYTYFCARKFANPMNKFTVEEIKTNAPELWSYIENLTKTEEIQKCEKKSDEFYAKIASN